MNGRITVVDDDSSILELMRVLLEGEGYQVQAFESAAAALEAARNQPPDLAVVDLMMPTMNGLDLLQAFRYDQRTRQLPVIICSAYYEDLHRTLRELGQDKIAYLRKPFQIHDLLEAVARMVPDAPEVSAQGKINARRTHRRAASLPLAS